MRKAVLVILSAVLILAGCSTTISVPYLQPSVIDMGGYRNLAVASAVPYSGYVPSSRWVRGIDFRAARYHVYGGFTSSTAASVAAYATDELMDTLSSSGFFNILPPSQTDAILESGSYGMDISEEFRRRGYDAVMIPRITGMTVDEFLYSVPHEVWWRDSDGRKHRRIEYDYYYEQSAHIEYTITVIDTETGRVAARRTFADSDKREDIFNPGWIRLSDTGYLFRRMLRSFNAGILHQFVPIARTYDVSLMKNKPEDKKAEAAYDMAKDGDYEGAEALFLSRWQENSHLPSGYNAALLMAASGSFDDAIALLGEVMDKYSSSDVRMLYRDLQTVRSRNEEAIDQVTGASSASALPADNGNAVYAAAMGR